MSMHELGETRSRRAPDHLLQTPDTFVWAPLPGMIHATACVHAAPALGAGFAMYTAALEPGGTLGATTHSRFVYVLQGAASIRREEKTEALLQGGFCHVPPLGEHSITAAADGARVMVIEKPYLEIGEAAPEFLFGHEGEIAGVPLMGDEGVLVRSLLPGDTRFDFAVNTMEYLPGASLSMVETHVMEHGLLMLDGGGIYRLGDAWYPVTKGDFIWMGAFCPQWFGALGKATARYLIYKDWNRHPLHPGVPR